MLAPRGATMGCATRPMLNIFLNVILPVFIVAGLGYLAARTLKPSASTLSQVTLYVLSPALIFKSLSNTTLSPDEGLGIVGFCLAHTVGLLILCWIITSLGRMERSLGRAFAITVLFMNVANYGLSVVLLAFGESGLERAVPYFVVQAVLGGTLAVYLASSSQTSGLGPLVTVFKIPTGYAAVAGLAVNLTHTPLPLFVTRPVELLSDAAIPLMLVVLGVQLAGIRGVEAPGATLLAVVTRLGLSVALAYGLTIVLGIDGLTRNVLLVMSAMPTAVHTIITTTQFNARPHFVTGVVVTSTLLSIPTLTALLTILTGSGP